jgi:hypothetical protein
VSSAGNLARAPGAAVSFRLADVNGDGLADACVRLPEGISCALNTGAGSFGAFRRYLADYTDAQGWGRLDSGASLQFADLNHDGKADVCGRSPEGLRCALADEHGTALVDARTWTAEFAAGAGFERGAGAFLLADIDGDGFADACGRSAEGVRCALNDGAGHFAASSVWLGPEGSEVLGGRWPSSGMTLLLGDLNHDGRADLCGRSSEGIHCALANPEGTRFEDLHRWSFRAEFSDATGWGESVGCHGSLRLADVNGDGFADLCGRWADGLVCALSNGSRFQRMQPFLPEGYTDAQGWRSEGRGATLRFQELDGDGHADVCGWGASGLFCALAPGAAGAVGVVGSSAR